MEQTGLLSLPVELVHYVSRYMREEDIASCARTCRSLWSALNDNSVWRRFLPAKDLSSLESVESQVSPAFQLDPVLSLTPPCDNWIQVMRKTHLLNNWRNGNYVQKSTRSSYYYSSGVFKIPKGKGQLFFKNRYLFMGRFTNDVDSDAIEVWDMENEPVLHTVINMIDKHYDSFYLVDNKLVVVECFKVDVFEITIPEKIFPLAYSFLIDDEVVSYKYPSYHFGSHDSRCVSWYHNPCADKYFVSSMFSDDQPILHVWDIANASKVGSFQSPLEGYSLTIHSTHKNKWLLHQRVQGFRYTYYMFFDIERRTFSNSVFKCEGYPEHVIFYEDCLIVFRNADACNSKGWYDTVCVVYDFNSNIELKRRRFNNAHKTHQINSTIVVNGTFVLLCFDCFQIIDALTLETLDHFQCDLDLFFITRQFNLFGSLIVLTSRENYALEWWDISNKKLISECRGKVYNHPFCHNELFTKIVFFEYSYVSVLHFW